MPPEPPRPSGRGDRNPWPFVALAVLLATGAALLVVTLTGGEDEAQGQTVRFQSPTSAGPDPFTKPADVRGRTKVKVGSGPFGGTGSDLVCDRELLISSLRARPDRLRAWAAVLGVSPTNAAVARYIRKLRPVTLTQDTRVTNHSFVGGRAVAFQSILQAGTAVLVDRNGEIVARCRCGNPVLKPLDLPEAICFGCPQDYLPPAPCFDCYRRYPDPPRVKGCCRSPERRPEPTPAATPPVQPQGVPTASFSPRVGNAGDLFTLSFTNFPANTEVNIHLIRPDGVEEDYASRTDASGSGVFAFNRDPTAVRGTYNATVAAGPSIASAQTTVRDGGPAGETGGGVDEGGGEVGEIGGGGTPPPEHAPLQCDPPRSQSEAERCAAGEAPGSVREP